MNKEELKLMAVEKSNKIFDSVLELRKISKTADEEARFDQIFNNLYDLNCSLIEEKK